MRPPEPLLDVLHLKLGIGFNGLIFHGHFVNGGYRTPRRTPHKNRAFWVRQDVFRIGNFNSAFGISIIAVEHLRGGFEGAGSGIVSGNLLTLVWPDRN